jgi:hypothetical protein
MKPMDRLPPAHVALRLRELPHRDRPAAALERERDREDDVVDGRAGKWFGLLDMPPALEDRHARADREDQDRDDERPEIQLAAIAERVRLVGGALGLFLPVEQQHLVAAVDHRVEAFGQHRRRSGHPGGDEFRHADPEIGGEGAVEDDVVLDASGQCLGHPAVLHEGTGLERAAFARGCLVRRDLDGALVGGRTRHPHSVILTKVRIQSHKLQRPLPWILTFVRMTGFGSAPSF